MATEKYQRYQQLDRGPASVVVAPAPQAAAGSLTDRLNVSKHDSSGQPIAAPIASISIQVPSTSQEQLQYQHQHQHHQQHRYAELTRRDENHNSAQQLPHRDSPINRCHHEAATRTLLFHHQNRFLANSTTDSLRTDISITDSDQTTTTSSQRQQQDQSSTPPPNYHEIPGIVPAYQGRSSGPPPSYDDVVNPNAPPPSYQSLFGQVREARKTSNGLVDLLRQLFLILIGTLGCTMIIGFLLLIPITMILVGVVYVNECKAENIPTFLVIGGIVWIMKNILNCYNQFKKDSTTSNRPPPRRTQTLSSRTSSSSTSTSSTAQGGESSASVLIVGPPQHETNITQASTQNSTTTMTTRRRHELEQSANRIRTPSLIGITSFKCESMLNYFLIVWFFAGCIVVYRIYEPDYDNPMSQSYCHRTVYLYAFWLITSAFIIMAIVLSCLCCLMASSLMNCNHGR